MFNKIVLIIALFFPSNDIIAQDRLRLIVFSAKWCSPCQSLKSNLKKEKIVFEEIDVDEKPELAEERSINKYPTSIIYVDDKEKERFVGNISIEKIRALINKHKPK